MVEPIVLWNFVEKYVKRTLQQYGHVIDDADGFCHNSGEVYQDFRYIFFKITGVKIQRV